MIDKIKKFISDRPKLKSALLFTKTALSVFLVLLCLIMSISMACHSCDFSKSDSKSFVSSEPILSSRSADDGIGTWIFADSIEISENNYYEASFTSNGVQYSAFALDYGAPPWALRYDSSVSGDSVFAFLSPPMGDGWQNVNYKTVVITDTSLVSSLTDFLTWLKANATYQGGTEPEPEPEPIPSDTLNSFSSIIPVSASAPFGSITDNSFSIPNTSVAYNTAKWLYDTATSSALQGKGGNIQEYPPKGWNIASNSINAPIQGEAPWTYDSTTFNAFSPSLSPTFYDSLFFEAGGANPQTFLIFYFSATRSDGATDLTVSVPLYLQILPSTVNNIPSYTFRWYFGYENNNTAPNLSLTYLQNCYINNALAFDFSSVVNFSANPYLVFPDFSNLAVTPAALIATAYKSVFVTKLTGDNYSSGYAAGYAQGVKDTNASNESLLGMKYVYAATEEFLTQPFFGEFSIGGILAAGIGAACLIWILKLFAGG